MPSASLKATNRKTPILEAAASVGGVTSEAAVIRENVPFSDEHVSGISTYDEKVSSF